MVHPHIYANTGPKSNLLSPDSQLQSSGSIFCSLADQLESSGDRWYMYMHQRDLQSIWLPRWAPERDRWRDWCLRLLLFLPFWIGTWLLYSVLACTCRCVIFDHVYRVWLAGVIWNSATADQVLPNWFANSATPCSTRPTGTTSRTTPRLAPWASLPPHWAEDQSPEIPTAGRHWIYRWGAEANWLHVPIYDPARQAI